MRLVAGLVDERVHFVDKSASDRCALVTFRISPGRLSATEMADSALASPGRYVGEMFRRLRRFHSDRDGILIFNPRFAPTSHQVRLAIATSSRDVEDQPAAVLSDPSGAPLAYYLRDRAVDSIPAVHLALLSTIHAPLDALLLEETLGERVPRIVPDGMTSLGSPDANGFVLGGLNRRALLFAAGQAVRRLRAFGPAERGSLIRTGTRVALLGFHAGDILFLCQALRGLEPACWRPLVLRDYEDIVRWSAPEIDPVPVDGFLPNRDGRVVTDEHEFLLGLAEGLVGAGADPTFWHFLRPYRDYADTTFHLREAFRFALGDPLEERRPDFGYVPREDVRRVAQQPIERRVVVHLDGGWPVKGYPAGSRRALLEALASNGYRPVVLGSPVPDCEGVPHLEYSTLGEYRALLDGAVGLVGIDSFPAHFAVEYGVPTVHLFGSTRPENSRYDPGPFSDSAGGALDCVPCKQVDRCPKFGGNVCRAHEEPERIVEKLSALLARPEAARAGGEDEAIPFPAGPQIVAAERDAFLDELFSQVRFETLDRCPYCGAEETQPQGTRFRLIMARCERCRLWFVRNRIVEEDLGLLYSPQYWRVFMRLHGYPAAGDRYAYDYRASAGRRDLILEYADPGGRVLDIGCGFAALSRRLRERSIDAYGLEMDRSLARRVEVTSAVPVLFDLDEQAAVGRSYQVVSMFDVIEHVYRPRPFLKSVESLLTENGVVIMETSRTDCEAFAEAGLHHEDVKPIEHPYLYTTDHLEGLLNEVGMRIERKIFPDGERQARIVCVARRDPAGQPRP